jgi:ribosomal subunit interface protein
MDLTVVTKLNPGTKEQETEERVQRHLSKKLEKLEARMGKPVAARIALEELTVGWDVTITVSGTTPELIGKAHEDGLLKALDAAVDKLTRQFENEAEKRTGRERQRRSSGTIKASPR